MEAEVLSGEYRNICRGSVEASRSRICQGHYLDFLPQGSNRSGVEGRPWREGVAGIHGQVLPRRIGWILEVGRDRKSTRLNSSHDQNSYAVFCLKKKIH